MRLKVFTFFWIGSVVGLLAQDSPEWIWAGDPGFENSMEFQMESLPENGRLRATTDFADLEIFLNDRLLLSLEPYDEVAEIEVRPSDFRIGTNEFRVRASAHAGPSAVAFSLGAGDVSIQSGETWWAEAYGPVRPERFRVGHLAELTAAADYNQWKEAKLDALGETAFSVVPAGATIERMHTATPGEGSWVSMEFDPEGRLIVAREASGLLRLTLAGKSVSEVEVIEGTLEECRGLLWANDSLYANANNSKALYRLRDTTGDDQLDEVTELIQTEGAVGHGRNDLALDPDGRVYAIHGDSVTFPEGGSILPVPENSEPQGFLLRMNADGTQPEIVARGLRNPYGIAFNPDGEAFTYDADHERDLGLPLYRPTQISHLVEGANYGWWQAEESETSWPISAPDAWPATAYLGRGSPTAVAFLGPDLYALDWAYGRIVKVTLTPRGASYHGSAETWLRGRPLNVTDLEFRGDELYFITGGRKTQSALYRVALPPLEPLIETEQSRRRAEFSAQQRALRKRLARSEASDEAVWGALESYDPFLRNAARLAIERDAALRERFGKRVPVTGAAVLRAGHPFLLALARVDPGNVALREALREKVPDSGKLAQLTWARAVQHLGGLDELSYPEPVSIEVARELIALRVAKDDPSVIPDALSHLVTAVDQRDRLYFLEQLSLTKAGWTETTQREFALALLNAKRFAKGDRDLPEFLARVEAAALENAVHPGLLADILADDPAESPVELEPREFVKHWTMADFGESIDVDFDQSEGPILYRAARCILCHQHGTLGNPIGPNLTAVGNRFGRDDLLRAILEPSHVIAEGYETHRLTRIDGTEIIGRIVRDDLRESILHLATDPYASTADVRLAKSEVAKIEPLPVSPMPAGLLSTLDRREIEVLLMFLTRDVEYSELPSTSVSF